MRNKSRVQICVESEKSILASPSSDEAPSFGFGIIILSIKSQIMPFLLQCTSAIKITFWQYKREKIFFRLSNPWFFFRPSTNQNHPLVFQTLVFSFSWSVQTAFFISPSLIPLPIIFSLVTDIPKYFPIIQSTGLSAKIRNFLAASCLH